jgi:hypothetical protein
MPTLPSYVQKFVDTHILSQVQRYTSRLTNTSKHRGNYHVAMLFRGHKVIAVGQNRVEITGRGKAFSHMIHAEADVIRTLGNVQKLRGLKLVVIRIAPSGIINSKPCMACQCLLQKCMKEYGLKGYEHS